MRSDVVREGPSACREAFAAVEARRVSGAFHLHGRLRKHVLDPARRYDDAARLRRPHGLDAGQEGRVDPPRRKEARRGVDRSLRDARQSRQDGGGLPDAVPPPRRPRRKRCLGRGYARMERQKAVGERNPPGGRHAAVRYGLRPRLAGLKRSGSRRTLRHGLLCPHAQGEACATSTPVFTAQGGSARTA